MKKIKAAWLLLFLLIMQIPSAFAQQRPVKNIILVHGAFVDGSGWKPVADRLLKKGYAVTVVQHGLTSLGADAAVVNSAIAAQNGPCILVGHSYGGSLISQCGSDPKVVALVYIAAHAPEAGETSAANNKRIPPAYTSLKKLPNNFDMIDTQRFPMDFAADLPEDVARFMAISQVLPADTLFHSTVSSPAWKIKPSWYMVAQADRIINPDLERFYAKRAKSLVIEIPGASHAVFMSHPDDVVALIERASIGSSTGHWDQK